MVNALEAGLPPQPDFASVVPPRYLAVTQLGEQLGWGAVPLRLHFSRLSCGGLNAAPTPMFCQPTTKRSPQAYGKSTLQGTNRPQTHAGYPIAWDNGGRMQMSNSPGFQL